MSYSQNNEEQIILRYFHGRIGNLLSLGENDGITLSNSFALIQRGWRGVLVEPSTNAYPRLQDLHRGNDKIVTLQVAVGKENCTSLFYESGELLGEGDIALVSTTKIEEVGRWKTLDMKYYEIEVPMIDFQTLLFKTPYQHFEFMTIDIEGAELDVLPQINFRELQTELVCVEWNGKHLQEFNDIMLPFGFKLIHSNAENLIYGIHTV